MSVSEGMSNRSLSEISEDEYMFKISVDLVAAAKRNLDFLNLISHSHWLHQKDTLVQAVRRYDELWMPLISDLMVGSTPPMVLPPLDIEWVWYCHTLNPVSYRQYCEERFSKIIWKPAIFNAENEDYAYDRCREIWVRRYPSEPFENEVDSSLKDFDVCNEELLGEISKHRCLYSKFSEPYMSELVYLVAAKRRYKAFLYMLQRYADGCSRLVPTADILLMWLTHQIYPTVYAADVMEMEETMWKVVSPWEAVEENDLEQTKKLWEKTFDEPYEKAGCEAIGRVLRVKPPIYWEVTDSDVNTNYKSMLPRFLLEVCILVKLNPKTNTSRTAKTNHFLRFRMLRSHRELKINQPVSNFDYDSWKKVWHLYSEFATKGIQLEVRHPGGRCFKGSNLVDSVTFTWNELLRVPSLSLGREINQEMSIVASLTPPVQANYLLKCVPDRVTDDSGAMISDVILRMNQYRPQEGRWLSRTVLDHAGRECFVVRMRVARGFWRRGGEVPVAVKWEDRIIEIREGCWSYVAGSIGRAPTKVAGTAIPKEPSEGWQSSWSFSTGDELLIKWGASRSISDICFDLKCQPSSDSWLRILKGRQMQYQETKGTAEEINNGKDDNEDDFVTLIRYSDESPNGKATALINWKLQLVELLPEEDAAFVLLLCISILRSVTEMRKEDLGGLLVRRRLKEAKLGARDWGSIVLRSSLCSPSVSSPYIQPWYRNPKAVMALDMVDTMNPVGIKYSPEEGGDNLYKRVIIT